jgi:hypothetical protein
MKPTKQRIIPTTSHGQYRASQFPCEAPLLAANNFIRQ